MPAPAVAAPAATNPLAAPGTDPNAALFSASQAAAATGTPFAQIKPTSPVVTSAAPVTTAVNSLGANIGSATGKPVVPPSPVIPNYNPTFDPYTDPDVAANTTAANAADQARVDQLEKARANEVANLTGQATAAKKALGETQANETGTTSRNLLSLQQGGQSASAQAYLVSLTQTHANEMNALQSKYDQAINTANNAYDEKDFQLAQDMTKNAKQVRDDAVARNQAFLDNFDKIQTQMRNDATAQFNEQKQAADLAKSARDYATSAGITQPFYELGGSLFSTATGQQISSANDFTAAGGKPDFSNVFVVQPNTNKQYAGGELGEFQYLVDQGVYKEGELQKFLNKKKQDAVDIAAAGRAPSQSDQDQTDWTKLTTGPGSIGTLLHFEPGTVDKSGTELVGTDGYLNPDLVKSIRTNVALQNPRLLPKFDSLVKPRMNPKDVASVGVGTYNPFY